MGTFSPPRPDLNAHERALRLSASEVVQEMADVIGRKLTAYIGGVKDVRAIDQWISGREMHGDTEQRLRFAFQIVGTLHEQFCKGDTGVADRSQSGTRRQGASPAIT